jgi:hypothetical protein
MALYFHTYIALPTPLADVRTRKKCGMFATEGGGKSLAEALWALLLDYANLAHPTRDRKTVSSLRSDAGTCALQ